MFITYLHIIYGLIDSNKHTFLWSESWNRPFDCFGNGCKLRMCPLQWRHNEHDGVSNHQSYDCLLNRLFRRRSKKTSKLRLTGLCEGNSPVIREFPAQKASNAENVFVWWRIMHIPENCSVELIIITKPTWHGQAYPITNPCRVCNATVTKRYLPSYDDDNTIWWSSNLDWIVTRVIFSYP